LISDNQGNCRFVTQFRANIAEVESAGKALGIWERGSNLSSRFVNGQSGARSALAGYLLSLGYKDFSRSQIDEIIKRLDKAQVEHTFIVGAYLWNINAQQITVQQKVQKTSP
jgi:hypothetical protein